MLRRAAVAFNVNVIKITNFQRIIGFDLTKKNWIKKKEKFKKI